jgi:predicted  nucleic acid-binding Zn-ribbon protein
MSGRVETIYRLQLTDTEIGNKRETLRSVEARLGENEQLLSARRAVHEAEEAVHRLRVRMRDSELDLEELTGKISSTEDTLYSGQVTNPKELSGMQQELDYLRRRQSGVEEETLAVMATLEGQESVLEAARAHLAEEEQRSEREQRALREEDEELRSQLADLEATRSEIVKSLAQKDISLYEGLRRQKAGQAVALIERGICQGCRVALPTSMVQKVRRGTEIVQCGTCQRIMYCAE